MQIAQRLLLVTTVICIVLAGCLYTKQNGKEKITDQWEKMCSEEFLHQVTMKQEVLLSEYICFAEEIKCIDSTVEFELTVYRKEWDIQGKHFYYLLTQEETEKMLEMENRISLDEGSIIQIAIKRKSKRNVYCAFVLGKDRR